MTMEQKLRERIVEVGQSLYQRGLSPGSSGNISARLEDGWLLTPTNSCLGELDPGSLCKLDWNGNLLEGSKPSKEYFLHLAMYQKRPASGAIVHLHSSFAAAVSCLDGLDPTSCIP
ncbi:MAG: class II aldolase/adducin family protein, partial [Verrucomicrobia bacterium]|nr:class II aldolase/adducin family protein [Verrucomicrobiota bacterium]